ncbi:uncharacterized protein LTR77_003530 [Saxophila tyrrhenica]|uniref:NTF2 domain-containing protein n=1 Tax=Saxophila tyrrhenica TaxID=1690608 RepID=A0AAV9PDV4_9PEZI|nr:hypothetical protein LTR77_003530 [Saxophila tyrrhenica]
MATEQVPINGNYAPHSGYNGLEQHPNSYAYSANGSSSSQATVTQAAPASSTPAAATSASSAAPNQQDVSKDEVGWFFVEQYYTTLSRSPEKLYLFYSKRSQHVSGQETDKVSVCVGQRAIHDRIKEHDFQDCKVRVTNVDSQASDNNIVIQVIGEISNKSQPHKKFTQTFVLAPQVKGYFVLNDVFRYLIEEEDEPEQVDTSAEEVQQAPAVPTGGYQEPAPTASETPAQPEGLTSSTDPAAVEHDAQQVDKEIESKVAADEAAESTEPKVNGHATAEEEVKEAEDAPAVAPAPVDEPVATEDVPSAAPEPVAQPEKPAAPAPTPSPPKQAPAQPAAPPKPAAPKTWASLAASANRVATPATPSSASSSTSQSKPTPKPAPAAQPAAAAAPTPQPPAPAQAAQREASPAQGSDEWTAVGSSHNRNQSRQANAQPEGPQHRGYIKNVHEGVDRNALRARLETFGELLWFDVADHKNCAFVDFKTLEGYNAAIAANPHVISDENLYVEKRKFLPGATAYNGRGRGRGGVGQGPPRGGFQGRGGYQGPRGGRGGGPGGAPRGRGSSIAT